MERFFEALEANSDWIKLSTFAEYTLKHKPAGRIYLPTASYSEMMEWALPAQQIEFLEKALHNVDSQYASFLRGGFWRNFLVKYPESNQLHKKMLSVSSRLQKLSAGNAGNADLALAQDKLWMGQSNDPYWHGVFGGLYLTNLRTANYQTLVAADALLDKVEDSRVAGETNVVGASAVGSEGSGGAFGQAVPARPGITIEQKDLDYDGQEEILIASKQASFCLAPAYGGALVEFDYKARPFNLIDTLARRFESYHVKLKQAVHQAHDHAEDSAAAKTIHGQVKTKEDNLDQYLVYDWYRRLCFLDHFLGKDVTLEQLSRCQYAEEGDFTVEPYQLLESAVNANLATVKLQRQGRIWLHGHGHALTVQKTYLVMADNAQVSVDYVLTNPGKTAIDFRFAPELNFNFLAPEAADRYFFDSQSQEKLAQPQLVSMGVCEMSSGIGIADHWLKVKLALTLSEAANIWRFPVFTVSNSEAGFEKIYQGSAIVPNWHKTLKPGESWSVKLQLQVDNL